MLPWQRFLGRTGILGSTSLHHSTNEEMQRTNGWLTNPSPSSPSLRLASNLVIQALKWAARQARWSRRDGNICFIFFTDLKLRPRKKIRARPSPSAAAQHLYAAAYTRLASRGRCVLPAFRVRLRQPFPIVSLVAPSVFRNPLREGRKSQLVNQ